MVNPDKTIFISHSTQDKTAVSAVCAAFDKAGLNYWISSRDIPNGATWSEAIMSGLNSSQAMVLVYSAQSNQSPHVKRELERAVSKRISIIPFRIEDVPMSLDMEYYISTRQWTEASNPPTEKQLEDLVQAVRRALRAEDGPGGRGVGSGRKKGMNRLVPLAAALLVVALGIFAVQKYLGGGREDPSRDTLAQNTLIDSRPTAGGDSLDLAKEEAVQPEEPEVRPVSVPVDYGRVTFTSQPTGARVILDGTFIGETPLHDYRVAGGSMEAHFMKNGYARATRSFAVANGGSRAVDATLSRLPGSLSVRTEPAGASLLLDGRLVGESPFTFSDLEKGWHTVEVSLPGYADRTDSVEVWYGQESTRNIRLEELRGRLSVEVVPSGRVLVDGSLKPNPDSGPLVLSLAPGTYEVEGRSPLYGSWFKTVEILGNDSRELVFDFTNEYSCTVWSDPPYAKIFVNGRFTDKYTPALLKLRPGKRAIQVDKDGYLSSAPRVFSVEADIPERVDFFLKKSP